MLTIAEKLARLQAEVEVLQNRLEQESRQPSINENIAAITGLRIQQLRKARHLSRAKLGVRAGMSMQHIWKMEATGANTPLLTLARVADGLGVPVRELFE